MPDLSRRRFLAASAAALAAAPHAATTAAHARQTSAPPDPFAGDHHRGPCSIASANGLRCTERAMALLRDGYDPADAVVQGVRIIEDDPTDSSVGLGGLPNEEGVVELDASVMHGPTHKSGAVASVRDIKNVAMVALLVLRTTNHCLLVGDGARRFALAHGFPAENLLTEDSRRAYLAWRASMSTIDARLNQDQQDTPVGKVWNEPGIGPLGLSLADSMNTTGTVHCSALTDKGDLASCTTTSGLSWKIPGRVGDSPIIGAGNYCDNDVGAAGSTGRGESNIITLASYEIVSQMERGQTPTQACLAALKRIDQRTKEHRLRGPDGRLRFGLTFYALRKDGAFGSASLYPGAHMAVCDDAGPRLVPAASLYDAPPTP